MNASALARLGGPRVTRVSRQAPRGVACSGSSQMASYWDERASRYEHGPSGAWHAAIARALVDAVAPQPGERLLDVGCGTGLCALHAASCGANVTGVDCSPAMVAAATARAAEALLPATFAVGDAALLDGFAAASVDALTAGALVPYLPDPPSALARWRQLLRPGGRCAFHGFQSASVLGVLLTNAVAGLGLSLDFERWTGSEDACANLLRSAGFAVSAITSLPITGEHTVTEAKAALSPMLANPLCAPLAAAVAADAVLCARLRGEYERLVEATAAGDGGGRLRTARRCLSPSARRDHVM